MVGREKQEKMTQEKISVLKGMTEQDDPIIHRQMVSELGISPYCILYHFKHILEEKIASKIEFHQLN